MTFFSLVFGLVALSWGAEALVKGASRIAVSLRVSSLVVGLTVVAFGTSMPEMVAGGVAAWKGNTDIVLGNVFGSNIANIGLILGVSALLRAIPVQRQTLLRELPLMLLATAAVYWLAATGEIGQRAGVLLITALVAFTWLALRWARQEPEAADAPRPSSPAPAKALSDDTADSDTSDPRTRLAVEFGRVLAGLVGLGLGAQVLVTSAVLLARQYGISEFVISVSMVALGTSLPELATSVVAAYRGETDVLVGNIVGSNIFNLLGALGVAAVIRPLPVAPEILAFDLPLVFVFSVAMALGLGLHRALVRWEGAVLLIGYVVYVGRLFI